MRAGIRANFRETVSVLDHTLHTINVTHVSVVHTHSSPSFGNTHAQKKRKRSSDAYRPFLLGDGDFGQLGGHTRRVVHGAGGIGAAAGR